MSAGDFFTRDGLIRVRLGRAVAARGVPSVDEEGDTSAQKNANLVLDRHFKKEPRLTVMHRPYAHRKSLMARAAEEFPEEFHLTRRSHFRSIEMFALHSYLIPYWAYYTGEAELVPPQLFRKDMFYWSNDPRHNQDVIDRIRETDPISFCIQAELSTHLTEKSVESYRQAMDTCLSRTNRVLRSDDGETLQRSPCPRLPAGRERLCHHRRLPWGDRGDDAPRLPGRGGQYDGRDDGTTRCGVP